MDRPRKLILDTIVGGRSETEPLDFWVNGYIFKVKAMQISLFHPNSSMPIDIEFVLFFKYNRA